jgi:hypothetical protein
MKTKIVILLATFFSAFAMLPDRTITGIVSDTNKVPISGVMVTVAGSRAMAMSDSVGKYSISVPTFSRSLFFSFVGYKTKEVKITKGSAMNVTLEAGTPGQEEVMLADHEDVAFIVEPGFAKMEG